MFVYRLTTHVACCFGEFFLSWTSGKCVYELCVEIEQFNTIAAFCMCILSWMSKCILSKFYLKLIMYHFAAVDCKLNFNPSSLWTRFWTEPVLICHLPFHSLADSDFHGHCPALLSNQCLSWSAMSSSLRTLTWHQFWYLS